MAFNRLRKTLTPAQRFYLQRRGVALVLQAEPTGRPREYWIDTTADTALALLADFDEQAFTAELTAERCPPVPVPVGVLVALLKAATGPPLAGAERALLVDYLADLQTTMNVEGNDLWPA